jgi:hypothetical protein
MMLNSMKPTTVITPFTTRVTVSVPGLVSHAVVRDPAKMPWPGFSKHHDGTGTTTWDSAGRRTADRLEAPTSVQATAWPSVGVGQGCGTTEGADTDGGFFITRLESGSACP